MPELLHLPPLASAIITITGVILAVVRLLTASRPFWDALPNWLQKGVPAAMVALGVIPPAIENATSWVTVAEAVVLAIGAYYTASRGDKRPPVDKDGGPRTERVKSDPKLTSDELQDKTPPSLPGARMIGLAMVCLCLISCARMADPCSEVTLATIQAGCEARIERECNGERSCPAYVECSRAIKTWRACTP